jgi:hypothetical protein
MSAANCGLCACEPITRDGIPRDLWPFLWRGCSRRRNGLNRDVFVNRPQFGGGDPVVLVRGVSRGVPPDRTSYDAKYRAKPEGRTPSVLSDDPCEQWRGKATACSDTGKDQPIDKPPFFYRNPTGNELVCSRIDH